MSKIKMLSKPNRAMDGDIAYAKEKHIPILPFMMESGIDEFYAKPEKFGERQYLNPFSPALRKLSICLRRKKTMLTLCTINSQGLRILKA